MRCPKCQAENNDSAKFCKNCGAGMIQAAGEARADIAPAEQPAQRNICKSCGAPLKENAKFCRACGQKVDLACSQEEEAVLSQPVQKQQIKTKNKKADKQGKKSSSNTGLIAVAVILALVLAVAAIAAVFILKAGKLPFNLPFLSQQGKGETITIDETAVETENAEESGLSEGEIEERLSPIDELVETGREEIENNEKLSEGIDHLKNAVEQYLETASAVNDEEIMADKLKSAYEAYCNGILKQVDMLDGQPLDGGVGGRYGQMVSELEDALELGARVKDAGFELDTEDVQGRLDSVKKDYPERLILAFNEFTEREQWSRTESWELMSGTFGGGMFEEGDLDNPVRLRYAYALAWFIQKENAEGVANGDKTPKAAAEYIAGLIQDTDYSPLLLREYMEYCKAAGRDYAQVQEAYDDIVAHIAGTQGLKIGEDVDLEHFWYFNDFGEYSVDDTNGVTKENRDWIRNRMSGVTF